MAGNVCLLLLIWRRIQGPIVAITVGASKEPFHVHESIICNSSLFFKTAMSGSWKESKEHTFKLPEDDPEIFALYLHWLYFAEIPVMLEKYAAKEEAARHRYKEYHNFVDAYVLGDKLLDGKFQNSIIDAILEMCSTPDAHDGRKYYPSMAVIKHAYIVTTESAGIRKLFVDLFVNTAAAKWLSRELPAEFLYSVAEGLMIKRTSYGGPIKASQYYAKPSLF